MLVTLYLSIQLTTIQYYLFCNFRKIRYLCTSNPKGYPSRASFSPDQAAASHRSSRSLSSQAPPRRRKAHTSPDGGIGRRAGLKHQWSNPCRFDPGSGYVTNRKSLTFKDLRFFLFLFAPRLHHKNFVDCRSLAGYQVHFYRKTALGTLFFRGI